MNKTRWFVAVTAALLALTFRPALGQGMADTTRGEQYTGVLANTAGGGTTPITIHIDSYSPREEVRPLATLLKERGQDAVVSALFKMKGRGWIRIGSSLGYEVPIIRSIPTTTGREIVIVADRPIQFWEQWRGTRSLDYPFGMIVLNLDASGRGVGKLIAAMRASFDREGRIELESYATEPFKIVGVMEESTK